MDITTSNFALHLFKEPLPTETKEQVDDVIFQTRCAFSEYLMIDVVQEAYNRPATAEGSKEEVTQHIKNLKSANMTINNLYLAVLDLAHGSKWRAVMLREEKRTTVSQPVNQVAIKSMQIAVPESNRRELGKHIGWTQPSCGSDNFWQSLHRRMMQGIWSSRLVFIAAGVP